MTGLYHHGTLQTRPLKLGPSQRLGGLRVSGGRVIGNDVGEIVGMGAFVPL